VPPVTPKYRCSRCQAPLAVEELRSEVLTYVPGDDGRFRLTHAVIHPSEFQCRACLQPLTPADLNWFLSQQAP
jgi:hypothetical protein